jgi:signal peptide peptidase SppA
MAEDLAVGGVVLYPRILRALSSAPWAILPEKLAAICDLMALRAAGGRVSADEVQTLVGAARRGEVSRQGSVAVIPIMGTLVQRTGAIGESSGLQGLDGLAQQLRSALADPSVSSVLLQVDSPGGSVFGVPELAAEIAAARGQGKPIVAVADSMAASAAYWLASQADELVVTPSGLVGSIGVIAAHDDLSGALAQRGIVTTFVTAGKFKAEGASEFPLSAEAREQLQREVDRYYGMFVGAVAGGRGVPNAAVRTGMGEGRLVGAQAAVAQGMADRIGTFAETLARMQSGGYRRPRRRAQAAEDDAPYLLPAQIAPIEAAPGDAGEERAAETEPPSVAAEDPAVAADLEWRRRRLARQGALAAR